MMLPSRAMRPLPSRPSASRRCLKSQSDFGVGSVVTDAQAQEVFEAGAVKNLLLSGVVAQPVELLQHQHFEHEYGIKGRLAAFVPVACGITGELFE